jgi:hypothetical protein
MNPIACGRASSPSAALKTINQVIEFDSNATGCRKRHNTASVDSA